MSRFACVASQRALRDPVALQRAMAEYLTEPKARDWFDAGEPERRAGIVRLDRRTKLMYHQPDTVINRESFRATGRDSMLIWRWADIPEFAVRVASPPGVPAHSMPRNRCQAGRVRGA